MIHQQTLSIATRGRGTYDITAEIQRTVRGSGIRAGICHCFIRHTSASVILCENADPTVRRDLDAFFERLVPDGDLLYDHQSEGPDDMPAHVRTVITHADVTIPVCEGSCALGTWQGVYVYEHRIPGHQRQVVVTVMGDP
jgi:secondary thiamine-phosphate synthase enzyme